MPSFIDRRCFGYGCTDKIKLNCAYYVRSIHLQPFQPDRTGDECDFYTPRRVSWGAGPDEDND